MVWRFAPASLAPVQLRNAEPGDVLCPLRKSSTNDLWLRLVGDERDSPILHLSGQHAFKVWAVQNQATTNVPTLAIAKAPALRIEISNDSGIQSPYEPVKGALIIGTGGPFVLGSLDTQGFPVDCYVSLARWSIEGPADVGEMVASFSKWRLVQERSPSERVVLVSVGTW